MASMANDEAMLEELTNGSGDLHSLTAKMVFQQIPRDMPLKDIKKKFLRRMVGNTNENGIHPSLHPLQRCRGFPRNCETRCCMWHRSTLGLFEKSMCVP